MSVDLVRTKGIGSSVVTTGRGHGFSLGPRSFLRRCVLVLIVGVWLLACPGKALARYCNNPGCAMCLRIFGPMPGIGAGAGGSFLSSVVTSPALKAPGPFSVYDPTPHSGVDVVVQELKSLGLGPNHTLYDLGCGDGRVLLAAQRATGCKSVGIELQKHVMSKAIANVKKAGNPSGMMILQGDARKFDLSSADAVFIYLFPNLTAELVKKIPAETPIVSYSHPIPGRKTRRVEIGGHVLYVSGDLRANNLSPI